LAGLVCAAAGMKSKTGKVPVAADFDIYNRADVPEPKEPTVDDFMRILSRKG
jgi:hypothetical protein